MAIKKVPSLDGSGKIFNKHIPDRLQDTALNATYVPKWKANTAYLAGEAVVSPTGDTVTAKENFTSGTNYSAANWNVPTNVAAKLDKVEAAATYATKSYVDNAVGSGSGVAKTVQVGDSLTQNWASYLQPLITALGRTVDNIGIGGQGTGQIAARQGGSPALLTVTGNVIPASGPVSVTAYSKNLLQRPSDGTQTIDGVLAGVAGTLKLVQSGTTYTYTFSRKDAGLEMPCPPASPFAAGFPYQDSWPIIWTGRNDIGAGVFRVPKADIIADMKKMLGWSRQPARALVLSVLPRADQDTAGTAARAILDELNDALRTEFPGAWWDVAAFLRTDTAFTIAGVTKTAQDITDISNGLTPTSFRSDIVHLNATGYALLNKVLPHVLNGRGWNVASLPDLGVPPVTLHSNGVAGAVQRYVLSTNTAAVGAEIVSVKDQAGSADLVRMGANPFPRIAQVGDDFTAQFVPGAVGVGTVGALGANPATLNAPFTMAIVVRSLANAFNIFSVDGYRLQRAQNGTWFLGGGQADPATSGFVTLPATDDYVVLFGLCDGTNSRLVVNSTVSANAGTIVGKATAYSGFTKLGPQVGGMGGTIDVAEANVWPFILDATQRAAHVAAMKAQYQMIA
ncbi:hypothetical protein [Paenarthrobacter sp. JL.01a]|uniref:hypothetical protein n=1 Tax=Paenarthrobacter sp. JL.01a TaxID=2979324 RepID=UPI0021C8FC2E|nr:hypothetical protein [Paenarthrobacter sp. JL.01a]UXM92576.1 hypothetical protein N5P29_04400 [Paenarthrobacter sp. JL.01a]